MNRAVFDSAVLISGFLTKGGVAGELIDFAIGRYVLVLAPEILAETRRKLLTSPRIRKRYIYPDGAVDEYCHGLQELAELMHDLPPISGVVRDPNDDMIIACAVKAQADCIVTRDKDLLSLGSYQDIAITTPEQFIGLLRTHS